MKFITAKELRTILSSVPDDQPVFVSTGIDTDQTTVKSYSLHRFEDGCIQVCLFDTEMCGMNL